jgi:uridine kinase
MKAALLISGYLRSFKLNVKNIQDFILNNFDDVDIFLHITKNENNEDKYLNIQNLSESIEYINKILNPKIILCEENKKFVEDKKINDLYNTWYKFYTLNKLKQNEEELFGKYDIVIKSRPDLQLVDIKFKFDNLDSNSIIIPKESKIDKTKLLNPEDPYICDIFAYGPSSAMDNYFNVYLKLEKLISKCGHIPETVLYYYLKDSGLNIINSDIEYNVILSQCNLFAICGDSGSGKSTLAGLLKTYFSNSFLLECDRYHKWERNDPNWSSMTHLNPEANYIAKMNEDIFNLKIGNTIYQVDYDHSNGKFTEKQTIDSSDNIIVCGLHSLYNDCHGVYNFSIFMDTDDILKYEWKKKRDTSKRGYSDKEIQKQIDNRKNDYKIYIDPQKYKSDIIINFFYDEKSLNNDKISLKILISKKHNILNFLQIFSEYNIPFKFKLNGEYSEFYFNSYLSCPLWNSSIKMPHNYYSYILFLILNLK